MNPSIFLLFILICVIMASEKKKNNAWVIQYLKRRHGKEKEFMTEAAQKFIDRECIVYLLSGEVSGVIREVTGHAVVLETPHGRQALNLDFVIRIREYPRKKNGKKKLVVTD